MSVCFLLALYLAGQSPRALQRWCLELYSYSKTYNARYTYF